MIIRIEKAEKDKTPVETFEPQQAKKIKKEKKQASKVAPRNSRRKPLLLLMTEVTKKRNTPSNEKENRTIEVKLTWKRPIEC